MWDIANGNELCTIIFTDKKDWLITTPDGKFDGTRKGLEQIYYMKNMEILPWETNSSGYYTPDLLKQIINGN